jgi:predicted acyl esterase
MRATGSWHGDVDTGKASVWGNEIYNPERLEFFDRHLKGITVAEDDPPVRLYVLGTGDGTKTAEGHLNHGGYWRDEAEWPPARTQFQTLYMHEDGSLDPFASEDEDGSLTYTYDPEHPVPTVGGQLVGMFKITSPEDGGPALDDVPPFLDQWTLARNNLSEVIAAGGFHQKEGAEWIGAEEPYPLLKDRPDVLAFETDLLEDDTEVTGEVSVKLWVSSTAVDTDITVKLIDVYPESDDYPDGYHLNLTDTILRMRYRNSWTEPEMMTPGEPVEATITLWPISSVFKKGHRIRIDISSSNFPRFDVNPNTGEPVGRHTKMVKADNTLHTSAGLMSRVILPIIPS